MKKFGKILALALLATMTFAGCSSENASNSSSSNGSSATTDGLQYSREYVYKSGRSDYKIVIPENATSYESGAADELQALFQEATSYKLPIITDENLSAGDGKYIAIGDTKLLEESGITVDNDELMYSGYLIKTIGDDVYMTGSIDKNVVGTTYAAYEFLEQTLGFRQYTSDFYTLDKVQSLKLPLFDLVDIPDIDERSLGYLALNSNPDYAKRMRLQQYNGSTTSENWIATGHTMIHLLIPYETYGAAHPEWYCGGDGILRSNCLSNPEMREAMAQSVISLAKANTQARYLQIGMADNFTECFCELCEANRIKFGSYSGIQVDLMNAISDIVTPWVEENQPGRELNLVSFAYHWGEAPPVKLDENGNYVPYHPDLVCRDNVGMMWAPVAGDFAKSFKDPSAVNYYNEILGWDALTNVKTAYLYCINFKGYLINYNNFNSVQENYKMLAEHGYRSVYDQANADDTIGGAFEDLRIYVQSRIMWDTDLNYEELVKDFIKNVYGPAAESVQRYYDITRSWMTVLEAEGKINGTIYYNLVERSLWPKNLLDTLDNALTDGLKAIEPLQATDPETYTAIKNRIARERLTTQYLYLSFYTGHFAEEQVNDMLVDFEYYTNLYNISSLGEGVGAISDFINSKK